MNLERPDGDADRRPWITLEQVRGEQIARLTIVEPDGTRATNPVLLSRNELGGLHRAMGFVLSNWIGTMTEVEIDSIDFRR